MFHKSNPEIGARPGTLAIPPGSPPPRIRVVQYSPAGVTQREIDDPEQLREFAHTPETTWIDVQGLGDEAILRGIAKVFDLHPLALENAVNIPQRAKSDLYEEHQLIIARVPLSGPDAPTTPPQVCFVLGNDYLITFQERYLGVFDPVRERIRAGLGPIREAGPDYLAYALIDTLIDHYYPIAEDLSRRLEEVEEEIEGKPRPEILSEIHAIRRALVVLRRVGLPQREAINRLLRDQTPFIREEVRRYLRDTYDHIAQIVELIDANREMAQGLSEIYLSNVSFRSNEIMKMLTLVGSIFIPLTFIAGIYGMNFENMPELHHPAGYLGAIGTMVVVAVGMILFFRHKGWLG